MKKIVFKGSAVAIVTPINQDGSINYDVLGQLIEFQIKEGTDAIVSCGTTGESATMSDKEHYDVVKYTINKVAGRVPVIVGTGSNDTRHALELSKEAQNLGADALLIVTPYYNKASQSGLVKHYSYIADNVNTPIILYNVPSRTGCNINPSTYYELSKHPRIVATKEAGVDFSQIIQTRKLCGEDLSIYSGNDDQTIPVLSLGGIGVISVFANICPKISHDIINNFLEGRTKESLDLLLSNLDLIKSLFLDVNPIPVKAALNLMGYDCGMCRLPLSELDQKNFLKLKEALRIHKII